MILIANRGEIAVRVIRACKELGITSVAVYSEADAGAHHVRLADEGFPLSGSTATESYLDCAQLVAAVRASGAEAVHPGYGFLAENAAFAQAVADAGAVFIGPPPGAIEMMGDKLSARLAAQKAGVAVVPGTTEALDDAADVVAFGEAFGWPVAIKAAFGGGGRGIRVVASAAEAHDAFTSAAFEAEQGFGHAECYIERYLVWPRHIEMQVFADSHGRCVWLGERECSIQRRHQKLIEEAPAPSFDDEVRRAMGEAAVRVAQVAGYVGAGTVEFLYEDGGPGGSGVSPGNFWFLEMNTRLQVEHPVTELVTGLDLVAEQIRVADGAPLGFSQESLGHRGHAIECRINAEDPAGGRFIPSPGTVSTLTVPEGPGVRWDGGYEAGDVVSPYYDNLIGKLVVWAADRPAAIARMTAALGEMRLAGVPTTIPAHQVILTHPDFVAARHSTVWVEQQLTLPEAFVEESGRSQEVRVAGRWYTIPRPGEETRPPQQRSDGAAAGAGTGSGTIVSPMQGTVTRVLVEVGEAVEAGQGVCAVEAMKMESVLRSGIAGTVAEVRAVPGQSVPTGEVLVVIEPA